MSALCPVPDISTRFFSRPRPPGHLWSIFFPVRCSRSPRTGRSFRIARAVYTEGASVGGVARLAGQRQRRDRPSEPETDAIALLNERIRRDQGGRGEASSRNAMDSEEAEKYIRQVKEQQQRGLQKLKGDGDGKGGTFSYKVDPYTLRSGDYVVHKKVGIGRFVGIKFDVPKGSTVPIEYVFMEYADGMAKLPVGQASRMLYRYNL